MNRNCSQPETPEKERITQRVFEETKRFYQENFVFPGEMDQVLKIICDGTAHECWMHLEDGRYQEYLY